MNNVDAFPNMTAHNNKSTSCATKDYNCIAWALEKDDVWCWPDREGYSFWPIKNRKATQDVFIEMFSSFGYKCCENYTLEEGYQKIIIYMKDGNPTHASRQLKNGKWTSKLGANVDIEHDCPEVLNGPVYGIATIIMRRENGT
ncbi:MAG: hypothetical protein LBC51_00660 [Treponema sp.]|nr:hypothetical protein [Treponema sp.]